MEASRLAVPDDLDGVAELAREARAELRPTRGGDVWALREARPEPVESWLAEALADPDQLLLVGTVDEVVVGYACVHLETLRDGSLLAAIDDLFVTAEARAVGVGEVMMDQIVAWARERGCRGIDAFALPGNRPAKNFFETFGLVARGIVVHRALVDGDEVAS